MVERSSPNRPRTRRRPPDFALSSKTPGGDVGQAVLEGRVLSQSKFAPTPGGKPLRHVSGDLAIFCLASRLTQKCCDRRLPRITQRDAITSGSDSFTSGVRAAGRWVVPGSRLFSHVSAGLTSRRNSRGRRNACQSGSLPGAIANPLRDSSRLREQLARRSLPEF